MSYIPGAGMNKPLNMLEGPVYPDIKKGPPRFRSSGKHWTVKPSVLRDTENMTQFYEPAVLVQARDYNTTVYGKSSHRDTVNGEFRPPLIDPIDDVFPLSRLPRKPVVPRINPSTAGHSGTSGYTARNQRPSNIEAHITDRITSGNWRATFYAPMETPADNSVLPDLEMVLPSISASAGFIYPSIDAPASQVTLDYERVDPGMDTGFSTQIRLDGDSGIENLQLDYNRPQYSASAGMNTPVKIDAESRVDLDLKYVRPQYSASAGMSTPVQIDAPDPRQSLELIARTEVPHTVLNPAPTGDRSTLVPIQETTSFIQDGNPNYSYQVPSKYEYTSRNELSHQPHFTQKLQVRGNITNTGFIPQIGIMNPGRMINTRAQPKKAVYSI